MPSQFHREQAMFQGMWHTENKEQSKVHGGLDMTLWKKYRLQT